MIRCVVVDDEGPARRRMRQVLEREEDVEVVAECADGPEAVEALRAEDPDLVFLDVRMPGMSGFEVLRRVGPERVPAVVFVTAYEEHALEAFESRAVDYLVKPFTRARFEETMARVRRILGDTAEREALVRSLRGLLESEGPDEVGERLAVREGERVLLLRPSEVVRLEADGNHVRIHTDGGRHLKRTTLKGLLERLDPDRFARVHNSHAVNLARVRELHSGAHGDFELIMDEGSTVPVSRSYSTNVRRRLGL